MGTPYAEEDTCSGSNAWLEIQWYLFTAVVMLGAAYTLQRKEHVRGHYDVEYERPDQ